MKTQLKIIGVFTGCLAVIGGIGWWRAVQATSQIKPPVVRPADVRTATLTRKPYKVEESFYGRLQPNARVDMGFQIAGRVAQLGKSPDVKWTEGDVVKKGDLLAQLELDRYDALADQAKARLDQAQALQNQADAQVREAEAQLEQTRLELDRIRKMIEAGAGNQRELDRAQASFDAARSNVDAAKANRDSALAQYNMADADLKMAQVQRQDAKLIAPRDARIADVPVEVGQMVKVGDVVVSVVDLSMIKMVVSVVERQIPLLKVGQPARVEIIALGAHSRLHRDRGDVAPVRYGHVSVIPPAADPQSGLFNVEINVPNQDGLLLPGMVARADVLVMEKMAVAIPAEAAVRHGDSAEAFFIVNRYPAGLDLGELGKAEINVPTPVAHKVRFDPVVIDRDYYLVADLPQGLEQLIVEGQSRLSDGQPVAIVPEKTEQRTADVPTEGRVAP